MGSRALRSRRSARLRRPPQYLHARDLTRLLELDRADHQRERRDRHDELRYGDDDRIAALVAHSMKADVLVLLTDLDGLYTSGIHGSTPPPNSSPMSPRTIRCCRFVPTPAAAAAGSSGMASRTGSSRMASWSGVRTVIANAARDGVLPEAVDGEPVGTTFAGHDRRLPAGRRRTLDRVRGRGARHRRRRRRRPFAP